MTFNAFTAIARNSRAIAAGLVLAAGVPVVGVAPAASAQNVLVMNEEQILRQSQVGQHIASQLEVVGQEIQAELDQMRQPIEQESERLNADTSALSEQAIASRPDLVQRIQQLQADAREFEIKRRQLAQELVATERAAMRPVLEELQAVLQEIFNERQAAVLLQRDEVVFASESVNITQTAIERLNARISTTPVNRVRLTQEQLRQMGLAPAQAPGGEAAMPQSRLTTPNR